MSDAITIKNWSWGPLSPKVRAKGVQRCVCVWGGGGGGGG